jgi:hypothetical protein
LGDQPPLTGAAREGQAPADPGHDFPVFKSAGSAPQTADEGSSSADPVVRAHEAVHADDADRETTGTGTAADASRTADGVDGAASDRRGDADREAGPADLTEGGRSRRDMNGARADDTAAEPRSSMAAQTGERGDVSDNGDRGRREGSRGWNDRGPKRRDEGRGDGPGGDRRRGGDGGRAPGGRMMDRRPPRPEEPDLPDDVQASDLDTSIRRDLLSLDKGNAETVARHLVMAARLLDDDPGLALAHARAARQRAGRIAVVRETAGVVAYHAGEWAEALSELRTARRMSGGSGLLAVMADCERGLGRPERAIELGRSEEARALRGDDATELRIVVAGARMDLGQYDQAVVTLQTNDLDPARTGSAAARLFYAYADALVAAGRTDEGLTWFLNAAAADLDGETDAEERAAELTGDA